MSTKKISIQNRALGAIFQPPSPSVNPPSIVKRTQTGPGLMAEHLAKDSEALRENESLKAELKRWEGATVSKKLDPNRIKASRWVNRHKDSFTGPEFEAFKTEIKSAGGNIQPIKVRPVPNADTECYEIIFGHRRHQACLELGLEVFSLVSPVDDIALFEEMDRENRQRADLRPYEQGMMYRRALDEGLYSSLRKLSESLNVALASVSDVVALAHLPDIVLDAFPSRLDVQLRWVKLLKDALAANHDSVLEDAARIARERKEGAMISAKSTLDQLVQSSKQTSGMPVEIKANGSTVAVMKSVKGKVTVSFVSNKLSPAHLGRLEWFIANELLA